MAAVRSRLYWTCWVFYGRATVDWPLLVSHVGQCDIAAGMAPWSPQRLQFTPIQLCVGLRGPTFLGDDVNLGHHYVTSGAVMDQGVSVARYRNPCRGLG